MMQRYLATLIIPPLGFGILLFSLYVWFEPVSGDLTRIGQWSERDFGGNAPQSSIDVLDNSKSAKNPDIAVLGDSFSAYNLWQSRISHKHRKSLLTFRYEGAGCLGNWIRWASQVSSAEIVMIETVERSFYSRFHEIETCNETEPRVVQNVFVGSSKTERATWATWPIEIDASYLFQTAKNTRRLSRRQFRLLRRNNVVNAPIQSKCAKFSNRRADRLLYFGDDEMKRYWTDELRGKAVLNALKVQKIFESHGKKFVLVVVPDKLSVYRDCITSQKVNAGDFNITDELIAAGVSAVDLHDVFIEHRNTLTDLYLPNDTHLSGQGYILMADAIGKELFPRSAQF